MPEIKTIPTVTTLSVTGSSISILTRYIEDACSVPWILYAFVGENVGSYNNVPYIEGELVVEFSCNKYSQNIDAWIDGNGDLIVKSTGGDVDNYSIDDNGELIWSDE